MANDGYVQLPPDSTGKEVDATQTTTSQGTVLRQRVVLGDDSSATVVDATAFLQLMNTQNALLLTIASQLNNLLAAMNGQQVPLPSIPQ